MEPSTILQAINPSEGSIKKVLIDDIIQDKYLLVDSKWRVICIHGTCIKPVRLNKMCTKHAKASSVSIEVGSIIVRNSKMYVWTSNSTWKPKCSIFACTNPIKVNRDYCRDHESQEDRTNINHGSIAETFSFLKKLSEE